MDRGTLAQSSGATCISTISPPTMGVAPLPPLLDRDASPCYNHINITVTALWVATPFLSTVSVAAVCVAVSTNQWLLTQENIKNDNYTGRDDNEYLPKNTFSGLWTLCHTKPGRQEFFCSNIEYFPKEEYSPDVKDSTMAIPYTVTKSAAFFLLSTFLLFVGEFCCLWGHFSRQRRLFTFVSGVVFIISGLLMLIGLVMYISIFKAEVGGKLRPTSQLQPAVFTYQYGYSFLLYVAGFVSTELSGTCAVFLYIYWHQKDWKKKGYEFRAKFASLDFDPVGDAHPYCRRHPNNLSFNSMNCPPENFTAFGQRRLYLDRRSESLSDDESPSPSCLQHSTSCSVFNDFYPPQYVPKKQNRKIGTDDPTEDCPALSFQLCQHHLTSEYPCEYLTYNLHPKDASTNTDSIWVEEDADDCSSILHDHEFVPFDLDENPAPVPKDTFADVKRCIRRDGRMLETLTKSTVV